jgi:F-type H+-transporting ATPase subunit delta
MSGRLLVKRYALALYEAAEEKNQLDEIEADILSLAELMKVPEIRDYCLKVSVSSKAVGQFIKLGLLPVIKNDLMCNFLMTVRYNSRQALLPFLEEAFFEVKDSKCGITPVLVEFACEPDTAILELIKIKMSKKLGCPINLSYKIDKGALKGFRCFWKNHLIDRTARGRIRQLRHALLNN